MENFSELYNQYIDVLFAYGCKMTNDREMVKDCIHDVFVKFFTKHDELGEVSNVRSYLVTALRNRINDEFRRIARMPDTDTSTKQATTEIDDVPNFEQLEMEMHIQKKLMDNIAKLSPRQQQIIQLYYMERRKYEEICIIMGINYQSVRNLMHRSITSLRKMSVS